MATVGASTRTQVNFNGGVWSPFMHDRIDLLKYQTASRTITNFGLTPYGPMRRRKGTRHIAESKSNTKVRMIDFVYSATTTYTLELGNLYMRFYSNGGRVEVTGTPVEVVTPWTTAELFDVNYVQDDDIMYLAVAGQPRQKLTRLTATSFDLSEVVDTIPPLLDENTTTTTLTCSGTTGTGLTLSASVATFDDPLHVGSYWQLKHARDANFVELTADGNSSTLNIEGDWLFELTVGADTTVSWRIEQESQDGSTWEIIQKGTVLVTDLSLVTRTGTQETDRPMRIVMADLASTGTPVARMYLENKNAFSIGLVKITAVASTTSATCDVIETLFATTATPYWSEGAFSDYRGHPSVNGIYEGRLWWGGTSHEPQVFYGSKANNNYETYPVGTLDTDRVKYKLGGTTRNAIKWIIGQEDLLLGTTGEEFRLGTGDSYQPLTPSVIPRLRSQTNNGSSSVKPFIVGDSVLFVQRGGRKIREFVYSWENNKFSAPDITELAEHITEGGVTSTAYARNPYPILYATTGDGRLIGVLFEKSQQIAGWFEFTTDGLFESVAVVPGTGDDEVYVSVNRTIGGVTKRYIEMFDVTDWTDQEDAFHVDSGISYSGAATSTLTGLDHLDDETVQVLGDGAYLGEFVVSSGAISLGTQTVETAQVGLKFTSTWKPMKFNIDSARGNSIAQYKTMRSVELSVRQSMNVKVLDEDGDQKTIKWRHVDDLTSTAIPLKTFIADVEVESDASQDPFYTVVQDEPYPLEVQSVTTRYSITEGI